MNVPALQPFPAPSSSTIAGRALLLCAVLLLFAAPGFAWGEKGHEIVDEAATLALPTDMPLFFYRAFPDLVWLGNDPDRWRGGGPSLEAANPPEHFIDYEYARGLELPPDRYAFIALMGSSGRLRRFGITNSETGFLPWRIAELTQTLQVEFRLWRQSRPGSTEREIIERDIIHIAGVLGHYAGDVANPLHTSMNYNGWVTPNPNGYANDCEIHARFERDFVSHAIDLADVSPKLAAPRLRKDYFATALEEVESSNALVEAVYQVDQRGGFDTSHPAVSPEGFAFASDRLAAGASLLRDLWWSAWTNSAPQPKKN